MRKFCFFVFFISFLSQAADQAFLDIIETAKTDGTAPTTLLQNLRGIREESHMADAFLSCYGGTDFKEEPGASTKVFSTQIREDVDKFAQMLGEVYYKKGTSSWKDVDSLKFAKRLLANKKGYVSFIETEDVDYSSILGDGLDDMIQYRMNFQDSFLSLGDHINQIEHEPETEEDLAAILAVLGE